MSKRERAHSGSKRVKQKVKGKRTVFQLKKIFKEFDKEKFRQRTIVDF